MEALRGQKGSSFLSLVHGMAREKYHHPLKTDSAHLPQQVRAALPTQPLLSPSRDLSFRYLDQASTPLSLPLIGSMEDLEKH